MILRKVLLLLFFMAAQIWFNLPALAADDAMLANLDIQELMEVEVVTASRRAEPLSQVAGAVMVLSEEDIFRSGATTIPEALKFVPGVHVAQMDTDQWAVGIRGFNGALSSKHLVLVDGRPITSPTMDGVAWGISGIPLSTVKRIEIVRGTWSSLWGSDSFTGVINIITKTAAETQDWQSVTLAGTTGLEQTLRQGGEFGETGHYRVYAKADYKTGDWLTDSTGGRSSKSWVQGRSGFRTDWNNAFTDELSIQGEIAASNIRDGARGGPQIHDPRLREDSTGYAQLSWDRATGLDSGVHLRSSFTREKQSVGDMVGVTSTYDVELQHAVEQIGAHRFTYGIGSRYFWDDFTNGEKVTIDDNSKHALESNAFVQDRITLSPDSLYLILGSKVDSFGKGALEFQPTARLLQTSTDREFWLAVSRAVRSDSRWQRDGSYHIRFNGTDYTVVAPRSLTCEKMIAYEAGYRQTYSETMRLDLSTYINDYDQLSMLEFDSATNTAKLGNSLRGTAYGAEALLEWKTADWLTLRPSVSLINQRIYGSTNRPVGDSMPQAGTMGELKMQVMTTPAENVGFDVFASYVDSPTQREVPGYFSLDAHTSWRVRENVLLELIGRNLFEGHEQFSPLEVGPSLDLRVTWDF